MKKHDKNLPPEGHQPPPPREKRRRHRPHFGMVLLIILILAVAAVVILWQNGYIHFGKDSGQGSGEGGTSIVSNAADSSETENSENSAESIVIEIRVENETIFFDGTELANAEELKNKITETSDKKTYNFVHESAIKSAYDEVKSVLTDLERALGIKVNYNDSET